MHILHIINNLNNGGAERLLVDVLPFYLKNDIRVTVLQLSSSDSLPKYIELLQKETIDVFSLLEGGSLYNPWLLFKLKTFLKGHEFDLIHVHLFPAMYWVGLGRILGVKLPIVFTEHSIVNRRFNNRVFQPFDRAIYKSFDRIIAISPAIKEKLQSWTGMKNKIEVIRNGVNTNQIFTAAPYEMIAFKTENQLPLDSICMMMTARFSYPKDHKTLVDMMKLLPENFHIIFTGDGPEKESIQGYVQKLKLSKRVHFFGFRSDVIKLMKTVDINLLSSFYEGMSGVTLEALASGKPFLGADVPGINDVVPNNDFLFKKGDSDDLAKKIVAIVDSVELQNHMKLEALKFVEDFDIEENINEHIDLYNAILLK